jgi:hypothetical protein
MPTARESKAALSVVTSTAVDLAGTVLVGLNGSPEVRRAGLLEAVPEVIGYFTEGSAALAADFYADERDLAGVRGLFAVDLKINDRTVKIRRAVAWASDPLFNGDDEAAGKRLAQVVQLETARPYRDTILDNRRRDPESVGWTRIASPSACGFCRLLASKGAIFKKETADFAAHDGCGCTAAPVFRGGEMGPEASALQYIGSKRKRTPAEKAALRDAIAHFESL